MSGHANRRWAWTAFGPALIWLALLAGGPRDALASVSLRAETREGRTVHILVNDDQEWLIDPADGACLRPLQAGPAVEEPCVLLQDTWRGRVIPYSVRRANAEGGTAFVIVTWEGGDGVSVQKTLSALAGVRTIQAGYRFANGSGQAQAISSVSYSKAPNEKWGAAVRSRDGLRGVEGGSGEWTSDHDYVDWYALGDPTDGRGFAVSVDGGLVRSLQGARNPAALTLTGRTSLIPPGRTLSAGAWVAPLQGLGLPTGVSPLLVGKATAAQAGDTVRFRAELLPLAVAEPGRAVLALKDAEGRQVSMLEGPAGEMAPGSPVDMTFYWTSPEAGQYDVELRVPGLGAPLILGRCVVAGGTASLDVPPMTTVQKMALGRVADWVGAPSALGTGSVEAPALFVGREGPLRRVVLDVGIGEKETVLLAPGPALLHLESATLELGDLAARRAERRLSRSALACFDVLGSFAAAPFSGGGRVRVQRGPTWRLSGPFGLRVTVPSVPPDAYSAELSIPELGTQASMPIEVRVSPVRRLQLCPIRLFLAAGCAPMGTRWPAAMPPDGVSAVAQPSPFADLSLWQSMQEPDPDVSLETLLEPNRVERLPPLHFAGADLGAMLMSGTTDVVVLAPTGIPGAVEGAADPRAVRYLWQQLAVQIRGSGFGRPLLLQANLVPASAITGQWLAGAAAMRAAGWSVCGPIGGGVPDEALLRKLAGVTDALVFAGATAQDLARARKAVGESIRLGVWVPMPSPDASYAEGVDLVCSVPWRQADMVVLGRPPGQAGPDKATLAGPWLLWDGIRDGMDEINYLRTLWDTAGESAGAGVQDAPSARRRLMERLSAVLAELNAQGVTLSWRGHELVARGRARAVLAVDPAFQSQVDAARMLNEVISSRTGAALPVVDIETAAKANNLTRAITLGSVSTNRVLERLSGGDTSELAWRVEKNGCWLAEYRSKGTDWLALVVADPAEWGAAVARFGAALHEDYGRLMRD